MFRLKYLLEGILKNKTKNLILFLQVLFCTLLFYFVTAEYINLIDLENKLNNLKNHDEIQILFDISDESRLFEDTFIETDILDKLNKFYIYLSENKNFKSYTLNDSILELKNNRLSSEVNILHVNEEFMRQFNIDISDGRNFTKDDFKDTDVTPVLLGEDFKKYYSIGETINDYEDKIYKIIGFINKKSFYLDLKKSDNIYSFDNMVVAPIQNKNIKSISDYDMLINNTYILSKDRDILSGIQNKSSELGLYTYKFKSLNSQFESIKISTKNYIESMSLILILILGFSILSCISNTLQYIDDNMKDISINLLCGASIKDILLRIMMPIITIMIISDSIVIFLDETGFASHITILFSIFITIFIMIFPYVKLNKIRLIDLLRRYN